MLAVFLHSSRNLAIVRILVLPYFSNSPCLGTKAVGTYTTNDNCTKNISSINGQV